MANLDGHGATGLHRAPWMAGIAQLVERQVVVLDVTGSSPVARPILPMRDERASRRPGAGRRGGAPHGRRRQAAAGGWRPADAGAVIAALGLRPIAISANGDPARFAAFGLPVLPDGAFQGEGPLAGVLAGLRVGRFTGHDRPADGARRYAFPAARTWRRGCAGARLRGEQRTAAPPGRALAHCLREYVASVLIGTRIQTRRGTFAERIGMRYVDFASASPTILSLM